MFLNPNLRGKGGVETNPDILFSQLMNRLADNPIEKERLVPCFALLHELAPDLERKVLQIASGLYGDINCHGASMYLIGFTNKPQAVQPVEMSNLVESMTSSTESNSRSLVILRRTHSSEIVAHSGILLTTQDGRKLILHKEGYDYPFKIEPAENAFPKMSIDRLQFYSLRR